MKRYPEYKDSGVEWLEKIPKEWIVIRLKFLSDIKTGDKDTVNRVEDGKYPFFVRADTIERIDTYSYDGEAVLTAGDGVGVGRVFHYINGKFDYHQRVYKVSNFKKIDGKFLFYYMKENFHKEVMKISAKSTVDSLRLPMFENFPVAFGKIKEQQSIVSYLDRKTELIDILIGKKEKQIDRLKEYRTATINQSVTKGLNPDAKRKDSGIEGFGEVPEHWQVCLIKRKLNKITDGAHISPETENGIYPFISTVNIYNSGVDFDNCLLTSEDNYQLLLRNGCNPKQNDILFSKDGTIGKTVLITEDKEFVVASSLIIITPNIKEVHAKYMLFLYQSAFVLDQINSFVKGAALKRISIQNISKIIGIFPSFNEQIEIANFIESQSFKIESLISNLIDEIKLLKKYRSSLISEVVTGKIDVRDEVLS